MKTGRYWVIGPIAWDTVLYVPRLPLQGGFVQATAVAGRPGGSGANVAVALATAGLPVNMVGYVGSDEHAAELVAHLAAAGVDSTHVHVLEASTSQVVILVELSGERTMIGVVPDEPAHVVVPSESIAPGDVVYFARAHRSRFGLLRMLVGRGVTVVSVPADDGGDPLPATYIAGSEQQFGGVDPATDPRYQQALGGGTAAVVITRGARGSVIYTSDGVTTQPARRVRAIDTTGAGDSFAAGVLLRLGQGASIVRAVETGTEWAALATTQRQSHPPPWSSVDDSGH